MYQIYKTVVNAQNRNISRCRLSKVKWLKHKCWKSSVHLKGPVTDTLALVHLMTLLIFPDITVFISSIHPSGDCQVFGDQLMQT